MPQVFYGLTRGSQTYRFAPNYVFNVDDTFLGNVGDAYELFSLAESEASYIAAVAIKINAEQLQVIIQGDYLANISQFNVVNMTTGDTFLLTLSNPLSLQDASYLGDYPANESKEKQITILHDIATGQNNVIYASIDFNNDGIYNWTKIGGFVDGRNGASILGVNNSIYQTIIDNVAKENDILLAGEDFTADNINFKIGDLYNIQSLQPLTYIFIGNVRGAKGEQGVQGLPGQNGTNGLTPTIGSNGNWFIGNVDTGVKAQGTNGQDGQDGQGFNIQTGVYSTPQNWGNPNNVNSEGDPLLQLPTLPQTNISGKGFVVYDPITTPLNPFYDLYWANDGDSTWSIMHPFSGLAGKDGTDGSTPYIQSGYWYINGTNTGVPATGAQGAQGEPGINFMGAWIADNEHHISDVVTYDGSAYYCIRAHTGVTTPPNLDSTNWTLFTSKGATGATGTTGATGATPNISVNATPLSADSNPTATRSGSNENPLITFGIPTPKKLYMHTINITITDNDLYLVVYSYKSTAFTQSEFISWLVSKGYTTTTHGGKAYPVSGTMYNTTDYKPCIAISTNGTNYWLQLRESGSNKAKEYAPNEFRAYVSEV